MADAHSEMLDLAIRLAEKEATGIQLTRAERVISDITWIDTQVSPNGFDGWLFNTSSEQIGRTMDALRAVGCTRIAAIVKSAMRLAGVDPSMPDNTRERRLDALTDKQRERLTEIDGQFYDSIDECMALCKAFAEREGIV